MLFANFIHRQYALLLKFLLITIHKQPKNVPIDFSSMNKFKKCAFSVSHILTGDECVQVNTAGRRLELAKNCSSIQYAPHSHGT